MGRSWGQLRLMVQAIVAAATIGGGVPIQYVFWQSIANRMG
jgi:hypothetical protein